MKTIFATEKDVKGLSEKKQELIDTIKSREIVSEILKFGVSNNQILQIIKMLSLEIEDRNQMLKIIDAVNNAESESIKTKINLEL
jgi:DNA-binding transcriptional regulator YhcF (GntR family)